VELTRCPVNETYESCGFLGTVIERELGKVRNSLYKTCSKDVVAVIHYLEKLSFILMYSYDSSTL
jgi:hypothetical protein